MYRWRTYDLKTKERLMDISSYKDEMASLNLNTEKEVRQAMEYLINNLEVDYD